MRVPSNIGVLALISIFLGGCITISIDSKGRSQVNDQENTQESSFVSDTSGNTSVSHEDKTTGQTFLFDQRNERRWGVVPGYYKSRRGEHEGAEVTVLYGNLGAAFGLEDRQVKYAELELASIVTLGIGARRRDDGKYATQVTYSLPWFFFFPYGRYIQGDPAQKFEAGFMVKIPIGSFYEQKNHISFGSGKPKQ